MINLRKTSAPVNVSDHVSLALVTSYRFTDYRFTDLPITDLALHFIPSSLFLSFLLTLSQKDHEKKLLPGLAWNVRKKYAEILLL
jgi:hypothetical protein